MAFNQGGHGGLVVVGCTLAVGVPDVAFIRRSLSGNSSVETRMETASPQRARTQTRLKPAFTEAVGRGFRKTSVCAVGQDAQNLDFLL